jgi:hypothetical protein
MSEQRCARFEEPGSYWDPDRCWTCGRPRAEHPADVSPVEAAVQAAERERQTHPSRVAPDAKLVGARRRWQAAYGRRG